MQDNPLNVEVEFIDNPDQRCACVLLLDTSSSMSGQPITELRKGLESFEQEVKEDVYARRRVELSIITFGSDVTVKQDFVTIDAFTTPEFEPNGYTFMGTAVIKAIEQVRDRKSVYRENGIDYYRPWIILITDGRPEGEPPDRFDEAVRMVHEEEANKGVAFFAIGVQNADMKCLEQLSVREPKLLRGLNFVDLFAWLSDSMKSVSNSRLDDQVQLAPTSWSVV